MATVTLTARYLDQLKSHGKRYEVFDAIVPGLAIRVSASGRKTFTLYYRHHRRMRRVGLGRYPDVLLEKARKIATQHRGRIFDGADPAGEKQTEHAQDDNTVQALYELYRSRKEKVLRSWSEVRRIMEKEVLPVWRHRRVADIRRRDVRELVEPKAQTAPIQGNRVLERISALFTFAVDQDWIEANPAWRIKKPGQERSRDRVLTRDELQELWPALHETEAKNADGTAKPRLSETLNDVFLVLLLTAQRCGEVCQMRWSEVDLTTGWWAIPGEISKNHDPHRVPLTTMVVEILKRRANVKNADDRYVFSNHRHTCVADRAKKAAAILCNGGVSFHFRAHDLRRTAASYMGDAGVNATPLIGHDATEKQLREVAGGCHIVHLACHAALREPSWASRLFLTPSEHDDGMLLAAEIARLRLEGALVVLAACQSGLGRTTADGVLGLGRAFMQAGARAMVLSLWRVGDAVTPYLMREFYKGVLGAAKELNGRRLDVAASIQRAQLLTRDNVSREPSDWGPWLVVGDGGLRIG